MGFNKYIWFGRKKNTTFSVNVLKIGRSTKTINIPG